jgi:hypothetical protein
MTDPLVVLVFVLANGADGQNEPAMPSMTAAARQALGANTVLLIEQRAVLPPDDEALSIAEHVRATAVVELDWVAQRTTVILHVHTTQRSGWAQREIDFAPNEAATEYGRTLGFAMASMITGLGVPPAAPEREPSAKLDPLPTPAEQNAVSNADQHTQSEQAGAPVVAPVTAPRAVEASAVASAGGGSASNSLGASVTASASALAWLAVQLDAGVRFGSITAAQATFTFLQFGAGATWRTVSTSGPQPFELDLRGDVFASDLLVYRAGATRSRWLPDASLSLEAVWFVVARSVGVVAAIGVDASFGTTSVAVGNDTVATIPPFRAIGALGVRTRF